MNKKQSLSPPLNARQMVRSLLPDTEVIDELLLWPPDLFAFTSQILSITGAYHLVISPPRHDVGTQHWITWPPRDEWAKPLWGKQDESTRPFWWADYVRRVGLTWREMLQRNFQREELWRCKQQEDPARREKAVRAKLGYPDRRKVRESGRQQDWVPRELWHHWQLVKSLTSPDSGGNIYEILCNEDEQEDEQCLVRNWEAFKALLTLHAIIDEACIGWGIRDLHFELNKRTGKWEPNEKKTRESEPAKFAEHLLETEGTLATINNQRCRVLPKRHTPQVGITLRSITSNLAYHRSSIDVRWKVSGLAPGKVPESSPRETGRPAVVNDLIERMAFRDKTFSVLLLPWPLHIHALDFETAARTGDRLHMDEKRYGLFSYAPRKPWFDDRMVTDALDSALVETKAVDMVILPECSLSKGEIDKFESAIGGDKYRVSSYVAGVRDNPSDGGNRRFNDNMVYFKMGVRELHRNAVMRYPPFEQDDESKDIQYKHHRWKLERFQITNYSLGHVLSPHKEWWEGIKIRRRKVTFINIGRELTICPLICEDLARQDPIADLIRTVGPSLVITILMDGPQKKDRWSARYASVLSEDPGSAVIALTSYGMVERWRPPHHPPSRVVALWNDGRGLEREIELEEGSLGILLSLSVSGDYEPTADGRVENFPTNTVTLGGIHQIHPLK